MEPFAMRVRCETAPREDLVAPGEHGSFDFALDPRGRLAWTTNDIDGDHVAAILLAGGIVAPRRLALASVERRTDDVLWLRYRMERGTT